MKWISLTLVLAMLVLNGCGTVSAEPSKVKLTWTAPGDDGDIGQADHYLIGWSTDSTSLVDDFATHIHATMPTTGPAGTAETYTADGLLPNTVYWFAIKVVDDALNYSNLSNVISIETKDAVAPGDVADLTGEAL